jgi:hypothetical protein
MLPNLCIDIIKFHQLSRIFQIESKMSTGINNKIEYKFLIKFQSGHKIADLTYNTIYSVIYEIFL